MMTEKSLPQPSSPEAKGRLFTPYVIVWAMLALLSVLYLGLLAAQPTMVAGVLGAGERTDAEAETAQITQAVAEVRSLRDTLDLFRNELIEMRAQLSNQTDQTRDLASRIAAIEAEPAEVAAAPNGKDAKGQKTAKAKGADPAERTAMAAPAEKAKGKDAPKKSASKSLETGSVEQPPAAAEPPITFGPATVTTTTTIAVPPAGGGSGQYGVQIATGPSVDSLRLSWSLLNERHGDSLRALEPRYKTDASGAEQSYDLVVGPVANADAARRLCQELALKATPCTVSQFTGSAL
jgi:hypothetical protein